MRKTKARTNSILCFLCLFVAAIFCLFVALIRNEDGLALTAFFYVRGESFLMLVRDLVETNAQHPFLLPVIAGPFGRHNRDHSFDQSFRQVNSHKKEAAA